jgi:hypothetical protein
VQNNRAFLLYPHRSERAFMEQLAAARIDDVAHKRPENITEDSMRIIALAVAALATLSFALPAAPAKAETVVIKKGHDHDAAWRRHHHKKVVVIKHDHDHHM